MQSRPSTHKPAIRGFRRPLLLIALILTVTNGASADEKDNEIALKVTKVKGAIALRHYIDVTVDHLGEWSQKSGHDPRKFALYIDGTKIEGLVPNSVYDSSTLRFDLRRTPDNKKNWDALLSRHLKEFFTLPEIKVPVTVGQDGVKTEGYDEVVLKVVDWTWFWIFVVSFALAIGLFWWLALKSDIIRDPGPQPEELDKTGKPIRKRYSLARTQMAFWFFIIIISYVFIWMVTSDLTTLTAGVLGLMSISAATGVGAAIVDSGKVSNRENERRVLEEKMKNAEVDVEKLTKEIGALDLATKAVPAPADLENQQAMLMAKQGELAAKQTEISQDGQAIQQLSAETKQNPSKRFIDDILSDDDGVSFHRFQIFAWTIVLILIFIGKVYQDLSMPEFDGTLLALLGISGGTYIAFKLPNQQG